MYKLIRSLLPVIAALFAATAGAQNADWKSTVEPLEGDTYRIVLEASIPAPYHMYDMGPYEGGPNAHRHRLHARRGSDPRRRRRTTHNARPPLRQDLRNGDRDLCRKGPVRPAGETLRAGILRQSADRMDALRRHELHAARRYGADNRHPCRRRAGNTAATAPAESEKAPAAEVAPVQKDVAEEARSGR